MNFVFSFYGISFFSVSNMKWFGFFFIGYICNGSFFRLGFVLYLFLFGCVLHVACIFRYFVVSIFYILHDISMQF